MNDDDILGIFNKLGLSYLQAKAYLALVKCGSRPTTIGNLSKLSNIVRQDLYRILPTLQKMGLVEKILSNPMLYQALSLQIGLSKLMAEKKIEFNKTQEMAISLIDTFQTNENRNDIEDSEQFIILSEVKSFIEKIKKEIAASECSIDFLYKTNRFSILSFYNIGLIEKAAKKGVKIRILLRDKIADVTKLRSIIALGKMNGVEIRFSEEIPVGGLAIFDNKRIFFRIANTIGDALCTKNFNTVKLGSVFFEKMWNEAHILIPQKKGAHAN